MDEARKILTSGIGESVRNGDRTVTSADFGGRILYECEDDSGYYLPDGIENALRFLYA